jgi:hypothetical protein
MVSTMFAMSLTGLVSVGVTAGTQWSIGSSRMMADNNASLALQSCARDIRDGLRATVSTNGRELTVVMPAVNLEGDFDRLTDGDVIRYYLSNGLLFRQRGTRTPIVLGKNLTALQFEVDRTKISIQLTTQQKNGNRVGETTLNTEVTLRNERPQ